jgi:hypothetical protein
MIIVASPSDAGIIATARAQSNNWPDIYGDTYILGQDQLPPLEAGENLFVIAHGIAKGASGVAEIGEQSGAFYVNGLEFWDNLKGIFHSLYSGDIYIDACFSANVAYDNFSFIEVLKAKTDGALTDVDIFGRFGRIGGDIPDPDAVGEWHLA